MNITNAKQVYYHNKDWECSNVIGDEFIACSHGNPNTHEKTLLYKVNLTTKVRVPLLHKWCTDNKSGLEDAYWLKNVNGYDWLGAERKVWGGDQANISVFRAKTGTNDYKWLFDIKPTTNIWEDYSVSSLCMKYESGMIKCVYEGRYKSNVNDYKTGYLEISPILLKVIYREKAPIISDRLVPDDYGSKISGHRQDVPYQSDWLAVVYKLVGNVWVKDYEPKDQDGRVGEYYFNSYYWKSNKDGLWKVTTQPPIEPPTGDYMKPIIKFEDGELIVTNLDTDVAKYSWQYSKTKGGYDGWLNFGDTYLIPTAYQIDGYEFWCYGFAKDGGKTVDSDRYVYGNVVEPPEPPPPPPPPPPPNTNAEIVAEIKVLLDKIK